MATRLSSPLIRNQASVSSIRRNSARDKAGVAHAPASLMQLQELAGDSAAVRRLDTWQHSANRLSSPRKGPRGGSSLPLQRITILEADATIDQNHDEWMDWYRTTCVPAFKVIAYRQGQDFPTYLGGMDENAFLTAVRELHRDAPDDRDTIRSVSELWKKEQIVKSGAYPDMLHKVNTNLLVNKTQKNDPGLPAFIQQYESGQMIWSRGMSVGHFAYGQLRSTGVLASEGTADVPTFTMGNNNPSRWLPGLNDVATADGLAHTVGRDEPGLREIANRVEIPIGMTVQYPVAPPTYVAYLNSGEQVIRGPVHNPTVHRVICLGPNGYSYKHQGGALDDLPPAAPYQGAVGAPEMQAWEQNAVNWMQNH